MSADDSVQPKLRLFDSHCHIHSSDYPLDAENELATAQAKGLVGLICAGTDLEDSRWAVDFVGRHPDAVWASVGLHPHHADLWERQAEEISRLAEAVGVVAIGECGLDYWHQRNPRTMQIKVLEAQMALSLQLDLPIILHIRGSREEPADAFAAVMAMLDNFPSIRGVTHSFTATVQEMAGLLSRNLYIGLNGIVTFGHSAALDQVVREIPLEKLLLESDAPFLTPVPFRGKINSPQYLAEVAGYIAGIREESVELVAEQTAGNARKLFLDNESRQSQTNTG